MVVCGVGWFPNVDAEEMWQWWYRRASYLDTLCFGYQTKKEERTIGGFVVTVMGPCVII